MSTPLVKESQRPSHSCSECSRRKTRCDKEIPCGNCRRRGKSHLCHVIPHQRPKDSSDSHSPSSSAQQLPSGGTDLEKLGYAAFGELESVRTSVDALRSKIAQLESILVQAFTRLKEEPLPDNGLLLDPRLVGAASYQQQPPTPASNYAPPSLQRANTQSAIQALDMLSAVKSDPGPFAPDAVAGVGLGSEDPSREGSEEEERDDLREKEVAASLSLEFLALGRNAQSSSAAAYAVDPFLSAQGASDYHTSITFDPATAAIPPSGTQLFSTLAALKGVLPPPAQTQAIMDHAITTLSWYHGSTCEPQLRAELAEFLAHGEHAVERSHPAYLALLFALLSAGVKHMSAAQLEALGDGGGLTIEEGKLLAKTHFDASKACLERANFLEDHTLWSVQAIAIIVIVLQDGGFSNLFPTLLTAGIAIAQSMGLHRLESDESWRDSMEGQPKSVKVKALITREVSKRVFWALTIQDWYSQALRRTTTVQPTQVTTPLPLNASDEDLLTGKLVNRDRNEFTVASNTLIWLQFAKVINDSYRHLDENPNPSYSFVLKTDAQMMAILDAVPAFMLEGSGPTIREGMSEDVVRTIRNSFAISSAHKVLMLHRPFLHRAFRDPRFESSRTRALAASRTILRVGAKSAEVKLWTVSYHIAAGASIVALDLFQRGSERAVLDEEREEIRAAEKALREMSEWSEIAQRGAALIENLLAEEARLADQPPPLLVVNKKKRKAHHASGENNGTPRLSDFTHAAKRVSLGGSSVASQTSTTSPSAGSLAGAGGLSASQLSPASTFGQQALAPSPQFAGAFSPAGHPGATPNEHNSSSATAFDGTAGGYSFPLPSSLPEEFLSVFLNTGFDPLDGAITDGPQDAAYFTGDTSAYEPGSATARYTAAGVAGASTFSGTSSAWERLERGAL